LPVLGLDIPAVEAGTAMCVGMVMMDMGTRAEVEMTAMGGHMAAHGPLLQAPGVLDGSSVGLGIRLVPVALQQAQR
jgi:hypothetical protein